MEYYIEKVLSNEDKPISFERIIIKIEKLLYLKEGRKVLLSPEERDNILDLLDKAVQKFKVYKTSSGNYIKMSKTLLKKGRFYADRNGAGKVNISIYNGYKKDENISIGKDKVFGAIDGDYVLVDPGCNRTPPKIVEIIDRFLVYIPGEVYSDGDKYYVRPIDKKKRNIIIALDEPAIEGEKVQVSLEKKYDDNTYSGKIVKRINIDEDYSQKVLWEYFKHGVDNDFSEESLKQLEQIPNVVRDIDRIGREDFTNWAIFTIDGEDTEDMDDAISCTINDKGNYVLGVHIADIASIIPEGSPLDRDAFRKGNSYYSGGFIIYMFPYKISKGIGSLNPNVDRMAISCIMEIDPEGQVINYRITPSIINSKIKMSYKKVNDILKTGVIDSQYIKYADNLRLMNKLAFLLRRERLKRGSIEFDRFDIRPYTDRNSKSFDFSIRTQDVAENLIGEFMLVANETVDKELSKRGLPCIHRVHGKPNKSKVVELLNLLRTINIPFDSYSADEIVSNKKVFQEFVKHICSNKYSSLLTAEAIKCMSRAKYSPKNIGHFGLAKDNYCHFTSPGRRYSDLTVHRILWDCVFNDDRDGMNRNKWMYKAPIIAENTTHTERISDDTERDVFRMFIVDYMNNYIGQEFEATVLYVSKNCLTVEINNMIEGTVRVKDLPGVYLHDPENYSLISLDNYDNYYVGDKLKLKLKSASKDTRKIDFTVVGKISESDIVNTIRNVKIKKRENT